MHEMKIKQNIGNNASKSTARLSPTPLSCNIHKAIVSDSIIPIERTTRYALSIAYGIDP